MCRHVTLFEELLLLKDFEKQENVLAEKVENKQQEKLDMQAKVTYSLYNLKKFKLNIHSICMTLYFRSWSAWS
jgi:hypothetical protein